MARCPKGTELSRAISVGADAELKAHVEQCPRCAAEWAATDRLIALGRELPVTLPSLEDREQLRIELLAQAAAAPRAPQRRWRPMALVAGGVAAVAAAVLALHGGTPQTAPHVDDGSLHGTIRAEADAHYEHFGPPRDEVVRLVSGTIAVDVRPLPPGQRFRVVTAAGGEVEVHGTSFHVSVFDGQLSEVRVDHGRVEVRTPSTRASLGPGDRWRALPATTVATATPPSAPSGALPTTIPEPHLQPLRAVRHTALPAAAARSSVPARGVAPAATETPPAATIAPSPTSAAHEPESPAESAFNDGWRALRRGQDAEAAAAFQRAAAAAPDGPIAEDAAWWNGVALARAHQDPAATTALRDFLTRHPASPRAGEAASYLGWLRLRAHDLAEAERDFRRAAADPAPAVRESARKGLESVAAEKKHATSSMN